MKPASTIYLDNNATTVLAPEVFVAMEPYFSVYYGNPSSLHGLGVQAERAIKQARATMAKIFHAQDHEIVFTSGGTEAINLAMKGVARACKRRGRHIITAATEHEAVLACMNSLIQDGFQVSFVKTDAYGRVSIEDIIQFISKETILVALMHVNNELGTIHPVEDIAKAIKKLNQNCLFFVDGVQAFGKRAIALENIDLYAISAHKFHGPKGAGALYIKEKTPLHPLISGGGQEQGFRSGTENVPGIVGLAKAAVLAYENLDQRVKHLCALRSYFVQKLQSLENVYIHSPPDGIENTINASFLGIPSEVMVHMLEARGIYVSAGAACGGTQRQPSHVLRAVGLPIEHIRSAIRFSFSYHQTHEAINNVLVAVQDVLQNLKAVL